MFYFGNGIDQKTLYIILAVITVLFLMSSGTSFIFSTLLTLPGVIIAIAFHEYAHAFVADKFGDYTPRNQGRLTLNPLAHIDPYGFVLLLFAGVGWGKPVEINPNNFTSNKKRQICEMWISLAGPLVNFALAIIFTVIYCLLYKFASKTQIVSIIMLLVLYTITINIGLGVFNLIPLPPLDGEKIFRNVLPYNAISWLDRNANTLQIIFIILWFTGMLGKLVSPVVNVIFKGLLMVIGKAFGI